MTGKPIIRAILKRDLRSWFSNPTGYVFITIFVLFCALMQFIPPRFFQENTASLASLAGWFRYLLLFFIPAVTMMVWAGERGRGTDEILLTLPASDARIVVGKFLAAAGIYTISLLFSLLLPFWLQELGDPDWGLIASSYLAFWCLGLFLISVGMVGSLLTENLTVSFILSALFCALVVFAEDLISFILPGLSRGWLGNGPIAYFDEMMRGLVTLKSLVFYGGSIAVLLYLNLVLLSRGRRWSPIQGVHLGLRLGAVVVGIFALTALVGRWGPRMDLTEERLHTLSEETLAVLDGLDAGRPVTVRAWVSPEVPRDHVPTRRELFDLLREYDARGGAALQVEVIETKRFEPEAREAEDNFGITHRTVYAEDGTRRRAFDLFLGLAVTCGSEEVVIPFLDKGLSVEYELTRSIRVASGAERPKIGILGTDVEMSGGIDYRTFERKPKWEIVRELELQYEVEKVDPDSEYPSGLNMIVVAMPSSLRQSQMDRLHDAILGGLPALLFDDPFPNVALDLRPSAPKSGGPPDPMTGRPTPDPEGKGDIQRFFRTFGIDWAPTYVAWDSFNPHPDIEPLPEWIFVGKGDEGTSFITQILKPAEPFNEKEQISSGLQEVLIWFGGCVTESLASGPGSRLSFVPLLRSTRVSGLNEENLLFRRDRFGRMDLNPNRPQIPTRESLILACRVRGRPSPASDSKVDVVFVPDLDMINLSFLWQFRREGEEEFRFDNVTFVLNCVDALVGETQFIDLRKRRPRDRRLTRIEQQEASFRATWLDEKRKAEEKAATGLEDAQKRLEARVKEIEENLDLDERAKRIRIESVRQVEQRRFDATSTAIENEKKRTIDKAKGSMNRKIAQIQNHYRFLAVMISPLPAILLGLIILLIRWQREQIAVPEIRSMRGGRR